MEAMVKWLWGANGLVLLAFLLVLALGYMTVLWLRTKLELERAWWLAEISTTGLMTMNVYQNMAMRTAKPQETKEAMDHALFGMCSEVGELATHWKAYLYYGVPFDRAYVVKELGDLLWFLQRAATAQLITLEEVAQTNVDKLRARFPAAYSNTAALARMDEQAFREQQEVRT